MVSLAKTSNTTGLDTLYSSTTGLDTLYSSTTGLVWRYTVQ